MSKPGQNRMMPSRGRFRHEGALASRETQRDYVSTPFAHALLGRMMRAQAATSPLWPDWRDGLHPSVRDAATRVVDEDRVRLHEFAAALHSSMVFAFNLFLPFRVGDASPLGRLLSGVLGRPVDVEGVTFEYAGPPDVLAEIAGDVPTEDERFTATDVGVRVVDWNGLRGLFNTEVKLAEGGFTPCYGATSRGNRRTDVCAAAARFLEDPGACYLRRPLRASRARRYWEIFTAAHGSVRAAFPGLDEAGACPFRFDAQQIMRNHALALGVVQAGFFDFAALCLVYHDDNPDVVPLWDAYAASTVDRSMFHRLPASAVAAASDPAWLRARYFLP
jgi:hypothetical protein